MAKRKHPKEIFSVRRINRTWWIVQKIEDTHSSFVKIESTKVRSQANQYADDYVEKYYVDLYLKQQLQNQHNRI
ncbi:hypothetical protein [Acinetobacter baylyi]|uniref:Uncharacterized protein n=1 Tax=Acinetobacter baylyi (strain ATCC 33305 / BD413 / ADP1) TaxID=62977 RepID=Q6FBS2_ACIAD|nr:hypothetical protein [Acinetobacter baylyi]ENV54826.1 hypothetical protein F952_01050 [Acinetobacter baylyi DSM 14961 = CIP 107474]KAF2372533.1 hypothetical protein BSL88_02545 [Acinetobacter baylyi]KAF2374024.1 hypothetical protein BSL67_08000 [Acinetobacter baylyi]KAF2378064.1 hypothetical protein BSN81_05980 [Acinetobacter baylyi]KAF2381630.1 hypothetical protein BSN82_15570 [Acinetobacter baylyi]